MWGSQKLRWRNSYPFSHWSVAIDLPEDISHLRFLIHFTSIISFCKTLLNLVSCIPIGKRTDAYGMVTDLTKNTDKRFVSEIGDFDLDLACQHRRHRDWQHQHWCQINHQKNDSARKTWRISCIEVSENHTCGRKLINIRRCLPVISIKRKMAWLHWINFNVKDAH